MKIKLKKGDKVMIISGKERGDKSTIVRVIPAKGMVVLDGKNMVKRHMGRTQNARQGQVIEKAMPLHISNVQLIDPANNKPTRIRITRAKDGARERIAIKSGKAL